MVNIIKTKSKKSQNEYSDFANYLICSIKGVFITFAGLILCSLFVLNNSEISGFVNILIYVSVALGSFVCGYLSFKRLKGRGVINGLISSISYSVILILFISLISELNVSANVLVVIPVSVIAGTIGGITSANM